MHHFIIIDLEIKQALLASKELERELDGEWVYFDFSDGLNGKGLFKIEHNQDAKVRESKFNSLALEANDDFLKHFLGLFTPSLESEISIHTAQSFKDFCLKINELLNEEKTIFDLSRSKYWIWHEADETESLFIGSGLKNFLELT